MFAKKIRCRVLELRWVSPSVFCVRFEPSRRFSYEAGQFLSVVVPDARTRRKRAKRCYSLSSSPEESRYLGRYELCVKLVPGGLGSTYLSTLRPGECFEAYAPYGGFTYRPASPARTVMFICTGTGVGPFRSMVQSEAFLAAPPQEAICLYGVRHEKEIAYREDFESAGVRLLCTVSQPSEQWNGFQGRVTDLLRKFPKDWKWHQTDFYICGNGEMAAEVRQILSGGYGVSPEAIFQENFSAPHSAPQAAEPARGKPALIPLPSFVKAG